MQTALETNNSQTVQTLQQLRYLKNREKKKKRMAPKNDIRWILEPTDSRKGFGEPTHPRQAKVSEGLTYVNHTKVLDRHDHALCHTEGRVGWGMVSRTLAEALMLSLQIVTEGLGQILNLLFWLLKDKWTWHTSSFPPHR